MFYIYSVRRTESIRCLHFRRCSHTMHEHHHLLSFAQLVPRHGRTQGDKTLKLCAAVVCSAHARTARGRGHPRNTMYGPPSHSLIIRKGLPFFALLVSLLHRRRARKLMDPILWLFASVWRTPPLSCARVLTSRFRRSVNRWCSSYALYDESVLYNSSS